MELRERFEALSSFDQQTILDKYRDVNLCDDWWDGIYTDFVLDMQALGIHIDTRTQRTAKGHIWEEPDISFSGFSSQGDGASFAGRMYCSDLLCRMEKIPAAQEMYARYKSDLDCHIVWSSKGHYCHSSSMKFDFEYDLPDVDDDAPALRQAAQQQVRDEFDSVMEEFFENLKKEIKGHADDLYIKLEEENDYLSDDEQVLEALIANDMLEDELKGYEDEQESA